MTEQARGANVYTGNPIDRLGDRRKDEGWLAELAAREDAWLLPVSAGRHLVVEGEGRTTIARTLAGGTPALRAALETHPHVLLGLLEGRPAIAIDLGEAAEAADLQLGAAFTDLREAASFLAADEAAVLAQARGFLNWRRTHRFCGRCGAATAPIEGGYAVRCTGCETTHFPRTDPAVIMLVTNGDRALLARNARFHDRRTFSTLAGFVEPGESLEEAVVREVAEECGVRAHGVRYHSSQPWPFPASVMLGFRAETDDTEPRIDEVEIIEAAFFTRAQIRAPEEHGFGLPPMTSIARRLIEDWCDEGDR